LVRNAAFKRPDGEIFYGDEADASGVLLKPCFNPSLLRSQAYTGAHLVVRGSSLHRLRGLRPETGTACLFDLVLRGEEDGAVIDAVREVLIAFSGRRPEPDGQERRQVLEQNLARQSGDIVVLPGLTPGSVRLRRTFDPPPVVTLVVPTRQTPSLGGRPFIANLLESLRRSTWPMSRLNVLIGDDRPSGEDLGDLARHPFKVTRLHTPRLPDAPFNYSAKMNRLWRAAETEHLVLMNDDVEVLAPDWLEAMMTFAVDEDVGGVGARLIYPNGLIQHAAMIGGLFGVFAHAWIGQSPDAPTYADWALVQRDWSAATGAVFATRRSVLQAVNGFDESLALEYNDVDLCLRLGALGLRIVQAPDAVLIHHEKASRGPSAPLGSETAAFLSRWGQIIADDPAYHPRLSRGSFVVEPVAEAGAWYRPGREDWSPSDQGRRQERPQMRRKNSRDRSDESP
jgi:hypothetical protein